MSSRQTIDSKAGRIVDLLELHYGTPHLADLRGPFEMILWEIVAYLTDDIRRMAAFEALRNRVGLSAEQILAAPVELLQEITRLGGSIAYESRAHRLHEASALVIEQFDGDLNGILSLPNDKALEVLMKFPMTGKPGAEKILLFCGVRPVLAVESNGLRALVRLGFGVDGSNYSKVYQSVRKSIEEELPRDCKFLTRAHQLLRVHGQEICRRSAPKCHVCPINSECDFFRS